MELGELPEGLRSLAAFFAERGWPLYAVGGWVRDRMLGLPAHDVDLCGPVPPEILLEGFRDRKDLWAAPAAPALGTLAVGAGHGKDAFRAEYTAFRRESYGRGGGHRPRSVTLGATLEEDALRRDFTVNALYWRLPGGGLADPLSGVAHLEKRLIRTARAPEAVFDDDGLRLLRLVRTACELEFDIDPPALTAAKRCVDRLRDIAAERIGAEFARILLADVRYGRFRGEVNPVARGLTLLTEMGALDLTVPEAAACRGMDGPGGDLLAHLIACCAAAPPRLAVRLAGLFHEAGMAQTGDSEDARAGAAAARRALGRLRMDKALTARTAALVERHAFDWDGRTPVREVRRFFAAMGDDFTRDFIALRRADRLALCGPEETDPAASWEAVREALEREGVPGSPDGIALNGREIAALMGEKPSPRVGRMKKALWLHVVDHPPDNTREELTRTVLRLMEQPARWDHNTDTIGED